MFSGIIGNSVIAAGGGGGSGLPGSDLVAWFDMSNADSVTAAGRLTAWANIAVDGFPASVVNASSGTNPLYTAFPPVESLNGVTVGRFFGRFLLATTGEDALLNDVLGGTVAMVFNPLNNDGGEFFSITGGGDDRLVLNQNGDRTIQIVATPGVSDTPASESGTGALTDDTWVVLIARADAASGTVRIVVDGSDHLADTNVTVSSAYDATAATELRFGSAANVSFAEIQVYNEALSNAEITTLTNFLTSKWGLA